MLVRSRVREEEKKKQEEQQREKQNRAKEFALMRRDEATYGRPQRGPAPQQHREQLRHTSPRPTSHSTHQNSPRRR